MNFIVLSSDNCQPCLALKRFLVDIGLDWEIKYKNSRFHANDPHIFDLLNVTSVPTIVEEIRNNEYEIKATGWPNCQAFAMDIKNLSNPILELEGITHGEEE